MKKTLQAIAIALMIAVMYDSGVKAAESLFYELMALPLSTSVSSYIQPESNYAFVVNDIYASSGNVKIHSAIQTHDGSSYGEIGDYFDHNSGIASTNVYYPTNNTNWPSGTDLYKKCSGDNTSVDYCAIKGAKYRVIYKNKNIVNKLSEVEGKIYFSN